MRLIASGDRPSCLAASSSEVEHFASSMSLRSSLNDQGLRAITEKILLPTEGQSRQADPFRSTALLGWGRPLGEAGDERNRGSWKLRNQDCGLS